MVAPILYTSLRRGNISLRLAISREWRELPEAVVSPERDISNNPDDWSRHWRPGRIRFEIVMGRNKGKGGGHWLSFDMFSVNFNHLIQFYFIKLLKSLWREGRNLLMQMLHQTISKCLYQCPDFLPIPLNVLLLHVYRLQIFLERPQAFQECFVLVEVLLHVDGERRLEQREDDVFLTVVVVMDDCNPRKGVPCKRNNIRRRCRNRHGVLVYRV